MDGFLASALVILGVIALLFLFKRWTESRLKTAKQKRDAVVAEVARRGGKVEIAGLRKSLEQSMAGYSAPDREQHMQAIDQIISSLEAKYGTHIPFDESVKMMDDLEAYLRQDKGAD